MKRGLLAGTVAALMLGTSAFAQSPSDQQRTNTPSATQSPSPKAPPAATSQSPQSDKSNAQQSPTNATADSPRPQAQSNQPNPPAQQQQAQQPPQQPSQTKSDGSANPPAQQQQQAQQPSQQPPSAQSRTNVNVSASLSESQRSRVSTSISRLNAKPVTNVNFSLSVGTVVPRNVRFQPLPADVVEVMPQYRGYNFILVREDIVIIDPATYKIVDVLPRGGKSTAVAPSPRKATFSDSEREAVRKHARSSRSEQRASRTEQRTTGSVASTRVRVGDRLPLSVEIRSFPEEIYVESPRLREYRYIERENRTYIIEPGERRIIEEIED